MSLIIKIFFEQRKKVFLFLSILIFIGITPVPAQDLCQVVSGAVIIAQDSQQTYLGKISNKFDQESIFNEFGTYGNKFNSKSIWNEFSTFGSKFSGNSPFNEFSTSPPMIIKNKKIIGYLSTNKYISNAISPNLLKELCG